MDSLSERVDALKDELHTTERLLAAADEKLYSASSQRLQAVHVRPHLASPCHAKVNALILSRAACDRVDALRPQTSSCADGGTDATIRSDSCGFSPADQGQTVKTIHFAGGK
jgi:hypothetical protein